MALVEVPSMTADTHSAWMRCESAVVAAMGAVNLATARVVEVIAELLDTNGWVGHGVDTPEHWVMWKTNSGRYRAEGLVTIARRRHELPRCYALFLEGRLTEDVMTRIARRVPASHDSAVACLAPDLLISQLTRVLKALPPLPDDEPRPDPERYLRLLTRPDGTGRGEWDLPADEHALVMAALTAGRDAEFRDRNDLATDAEVTDAQARAVTWADALVRMASEAADGLDPRFQRTGYRGERNQIVLHHHLDTDGRFGPGRLHLGGWVDRDTGRYLSCEAQVIEMVWRDGKLLGIAPTERTPNRRLRRALEHRDGGCSHPLCSQTRWLHAHHIRHWEDGGLTVPQNLVMLCPRCHRALHKREFTIDGNPEDGTLVFRDANGERIEPPVLGADPLPPPTPDQLRYQQPYGGRLMSRDVFWN